MGRWPLRNSEGGPATKCGIELPDYGQKMQPRTGFGVRRGVERGLLEAVHMLDPRTSSCALRLMFTLGLAACGVEVGEISEPTSSDRGEAPLDPSEGGDGTEATEPPPALIDDGGEVDPIHEPSIACASAFELDVIGLANEARIAAGRGAMDCVPDLVEVARAHSQDMCDRNYFAHTNLEDESPFDRMRTSGVRFRAAAENIARGQATPEVVHRAWMNSAGHRQNIMNGTYGRVGVGYVRCSDGQPHYWTQVFAD
ncbi:MAG: CAP domain-containing protein [Myxococcota bacterium]